MICHELDKPLASEVCASPHKATFRDRIAAAFLDAADHADQMGLHAGDEAVVRYWSEKADRYEAQAKFVLTMCDDDAPTLVANGSQ